eukprot:scaffold2377_cov376-Prasinococcus_capsulatus_cf.AAC.2
MGARAVHAIVAWLARVDTAPGSITRRGDLPKYCRARAPHPPEGRHACRTGCGFLAATPRARAGRAQYTAAARVERARRRRTASSTARGGATRTPPTGTPVRSMTWNLLKMFRYMYT